ncbi:MAG: DUF134 domain-containing protein [Candidatus Marinimicrobia bacterium]|nr:DUF134 domain-containing protein [Candidatus Neomarinimicrobiota bacterium]
MPRPQKERRVLEPPKIQGLKPMGVPARFLERVYLTLGEYEAIRLADYDGLDHQEAADIIGISRPTFSRLIEKARKKVAEAIVGVKELLIEGGNYTFATQLQRCMDCGDFERFESIAELVNACPSCGSQNIVHLNEWFGTRGGRGCRNRGGFRGGRGQ